MPDRSVNVVRVAQDDTNHLGRDIADQIIVWNTESPRAALMLAQHSLYGRYHLLLFQPAHDERSLIHAFWSLVRLPDGNRREVHNRRFFRYRTAVGNNTARAHF